VCVALVSAAGCGGGGVRRSDGAAGTGGSADGGAGLGGPGGVGGGGGVAGGAGGVVGAGGNVGTAGSSGTGPGAQFCAAYAAALCKKAFACTAPADQDAFFHAFFGPSETACAPAWAKLCADPPPANVTVDVNCAGKTVNESAKTTCLSGLDTVSCAAFNDPNYSDNCADVCTTGGTGTGGSIGTGGTGGAGGSGAGGSGGADGGADAKPSDGAAGASASDGGNDDHPVGTCTPPAAATDYACMKMARFTAAKQVVDGIGDEFCNVPPVHFTAGNAPYREGGNGIATAPPFPPPPEEITFRAAWSADAFHLHAHVVDPSIFVNADLNTLWNGDELEIFAAGGSNFTVTYPNGTSANAMEIGVAPPQGLVPARGVIYLGQNRVALDQKYWAVRTVADGYEVEVQLPWAGTAIPAGAGATLGFHLGLSTQDTDGVGREEYASLPVPGLAGSTCPQGHAMPWCDERAWCSPTAQ
jgi:hypothetical protein